MSDNLAAFEDLVLNHTPAYLTGPESFINDAQQSTNYWIGMETAGKPMADMVQAGTKIEDRVILEFAKKARQYNPNDSTVSYQRTDVTEKIEVPWRFTFTHVAFDDHEELLRGGSVSSPGRAIEVKNIIEAKYLEMYTDLTEHYEELAWQTPDPDTMDGAKAMDPYSLPYFVNEFDNSLFPGFSTVMGIDPVAKPNWQNYRGTYTQLPGANWDLYLALSEAIRKTKFKSMPFGPQYSTPDQRVEDLVIATNNEGIRHQEEAIQVNQDLRRRAGGSNEDPFAGDIEFRGVPIHYYDALDTAKIFATGASNAPDTADATVGNRAGPRYMGLNAKFMRMIHHKNIYMRKMPTQRDASQPWSFAVPMHSACNRFCKSRRKQFIVSPSATLT